MATTLVTGPDTRLAATVAALVGWGPGLTPSGDDALVGILAVLHRAVPTAIGDALLRRLAASLPPLLHRTTHISAHYLRLALDGHLSEPLVAVVDAAARHGAPTPQQVDSLCSTGATSGADALAGIVTLLTVLGAAAHLKDVA